MYPAPPVKKTEVFARIPDKYRRPGQISAERVAAGKSSPHTDCFIEGPAFDKAGNLYLVDIAFGRVFKVKPSGDIDVVAEWDGEPNGLKIHQDGRIFIADHKCGLLLLDPERGSVSSVAPRYMTENFKGLNDLYIARNGDIYFTDQGQSSIQDPSGRVYRRDVAGHTVRLLDNVPSPNGIVMSPNEKTLYVAATRGNCVWRANLLPDGTGLVRPGIFVQMSGASGPDGMAVDQAGNLVVAHAGAGIVWVFSPLGQPIWRIDSCQQAHTTNVAYGGPQNRHLYITESESGCVLVTEMEIAGQPMHSHL